MLSTINWINRDVFSGVPDNRFDDVFGGLATQAIAVVDAAINQWQRVVSSFNYGGAPDTYTVGVYMALAPLTTGSGVGASAGSIGSTNGKPSSATITINYRTIANSGNTSSGWWIDPSPMDNSEFIGVNANTSAWVGLPTAPLGGGDLFTVMLHELGHAMGLSSNAAINAFATDTGVVDSVNTPASTPASNLWRFDSPNVHSLWTAWNSSGGTGMAGTNSNGVEHSAPAGIAPIFQNNRTYYAYTDLMNASVTSRSTITDTHARMLQDVYGYTIVLPSTFGTFYDRLDANGTLTILPPAGNNNDTLDLQVSGGNLVVTLGLGAPVVGVDPTTIVSLIPTNLINNIVIDMGAGSDTVTIHPIYSSIPIVLNLGGGAGTDVLNVWGGAGYDAITVNNPSLVSTGLNLTNYGGAETLNLYTNGGDADVYLPNAGIALIATINGSGSGENIILHSLGLFTPVTIFGNGGNDTITLAPNGGTDIIRAAVTVDGGTGGDTLNLGNGTLASLTAAVVFNSGGGFDDKVVFNDQSTSTATTYSLTSTTVTRSPTFGGLTYSDLDQIVINFGSGADTVSILNGVTAVVHAFGNGGNDNFIVGGGNLTGYFPQDINGGLGTDTITYDDSANPSGTGWDINQNFHPNEIIYNGLISLFTTGFESVGILAGLSNDQINFLNDPTQNYNVNGGGGYDIFRWNALDNWFRDPNNGGAITHYVVNFDGGSGDTGTLLVDDTTRGAPTQYDINATSLFGTADTVYASLLSYTRLGTLNVLGSEQDNVFNLTGAAATTNYLLEGRGGPDTYAIAMDPAAATAPFFNIDCRGGTGTDVLNMGDSAFSAPTTYAITDFRIIRTTASTERIFPLNSIESITVTGTTAADTFAVGSFTSGAGLAINGANGNDTLNFGNNNLSATVTNMASFNFDGQGGYNTFNLLSVNDGTGEYARNLGAVSYFGAGYSITLSEANTQLMQIYPSSNGPSVSMVGVAPATTTAVHFNTPVNLGILKFGVGSKKVTGIQGAVIFDGGANGSSISVIDSLETIGRTVHLTQNSLGASPGDDLFPAGGSLTFTNIKAGGANPGLGLYLGSGADILYAQPSATGTITITGGNPTAAPGDNFRLSLAGVTNPVFTPNGAGAGTYTFGNAAAVNYTGFESASAYLPGDFSGNGIVGPEDYNVWKASFGMAVAPGTLGDGNGDGIVDAADYVVWRQNLGAGSPGAGTVTSATEPGSTSSGTHGVTEFIAESSNPLPMGEGTRVFAVAARYDVDRAIVMDSLRNVERASDVSERRVDHAPTSHDDLLIAWQADRPFDRSQHHDDSLELLHKNSDAETDEATADAFDLALELL